MFNRKQHFKNHNHLLSSKQFSYNINLQSWSWLPSLCQVLPIHTHTPWRSEFRFLAPSVCNPSLWGEGSKLRWIPGTHWSTNIAESMVSRFRKTHLKMKIESNGRHLMTSLASTRICTDVCTLIHTYMCSPIRKLFSQRFPNNAFSCPSLLPLACSCLLILSCY